MNFKFFNNPQNNFLFVPGPLQRLTMNGPAMTNVEYCYQFGDNEPVSFGNGPEALTITIQPNSNGITFDDGDNSFRIFARELQ
jgi:hypothetical protein